jgi:hypothetical protein
MNEFQKSVINRAAVKMSVMEEALEFYADPTIYSMPIQDMERHAFQDRGQRARSALGKFGKHSEEA